MGPDEGAVDSGEPGPRLQLVVFAVERELTFELPATGTLTIGRGDECDVRIDDQSVSRRHAILHLGSRLAIEDLGGVNGTLVRDCPSGQAAADTLHVRQVIARKADLAVGDTILFGTATVVVRHAPAVESAQLAADAPGVLVRDPAMQAVYDQALRAAATQINVLLLGETGVGKEVVAPGDPRALAARAGPFVGINCAALRDSLLESELFGHEKGAFTGAIRRSRACSRPRAGGTLFLDEVGELSPAMQAKLLRVLEERGRRSRRLEPPADDRRPAARRDEPRSGIRQPRGHVPERPLLSDQQPGAHDPAAARAGR